MPPWLADDHSADGGHFFETKCSFQKRHEYVDTLLEGARRAQYAEYEKAMNRFD